MYNREELRKAADIDDVNADNCAKCEVTGSGMTDTGNIVKYSVDC